MRRAEDVELAKEAAGQRDADERQQKDGEHRGGDGLPFAQAREIVDVQVPLVFARHVDHHREGAEVHQSVGGQIEHGRRRADLGAGGQRHQDVTRMRDRAVSQHAFEIVLRSAAKLPMVIESKAEIQTRGSHPLGDLLKCGQEDAQENGKGGGFGSRRHERADRRGRALIDVRRPDLERRSGNLEAEPDEHQRRRHADYDERRVAWPGY